MGVGCDGSFYRRRDTIDTRVVNDVVEGTGKIINDPSEVGGWLDIPPAMPCADSDSDGMPDVWEEQFGLNVHDPSDGVADENGNGYTNIEEFLNGADPLH